MKQACRSIFFLILLVFLLPQPGQADIMLLLENPAQNQKVTGIDVISGWAFSTIPGAKVRVRLLIDGTDIGDVPCCVDRADVAQQFSQFGSQALNSGFGQGINFNILSAESHKIKISVSDNSGSAAKEEEHTVTVIKPGGFEFLGQLDLLFAEARIDTKDQEIVLEKVQAREKGTGKSQQVTLRLAWRENTQTLGIVKTENEGEPTGIQSAQTFSGAPVQTEAAAETATITTTLENPVDQKAVSGISVVSGWTFPTTSGATIGSVQLRVDGSPTIALPCCFARADVQKAFPDQPQALRSGFGSPLNFNLLSSGAHTIGVEVTDSAGGSLTTDVQVTAVKLGDSEFLDQFDLSSATASIIGGQTLVLDKLKVRDKATQQVREIIADYAWQESCQCFVAQGVCGNGSIEPTEECDGATFAGDCSSLGFSGGTLTCRAITCELETKDCTGGPRLYITNVLSGTVSVVSTATNAVTNTIAVGQQPRGIAVSPNGAAAYVTNFADDTVSVIDTAANTVAVTIALRTGREKKGPLGAAFAPDGTKAYIVNGLESTVSVVNAATWSVTATMPVGKEPQAIVLSQDGARAYVTNFADNTVTVLDTNTGAIVTTIAVGAGPDGLALSPDGTKIYVANFDGDSLSVIDTATNKVVGDSLPLQFRPAKVVFAPDGARAYVSNFLTTFQTGSVSVIDTGETKILSEFEALDNPDSLVMLPNGKRLYVALFGRNGSGQAVQVISPIANSTVAVVEVGRGPFAIAVQP